MSQYMTYLLMIWGRLGASGHLNLIYIEYDLSKNWGEYPDTLLLS